MSDTWQTIEQAAVTLGLSVRTVNRHITAGKLESRLFEGRREVRVTLPDAATDKASGMVASASMSNGAEQPSATGTTDRVASNSTDPRQSPPTSRPGSNGASDVMAEAPTPRHSARDSAPDTASSTTTNEPRREQVTAEVVSDKPVDLQTMLALADSIDDKASLAVVAYQTLARAADNQVQSLRKVAYGAWAVVGVMAACIIVAVGWAAHRLTSAEGDAGRLHEQVSKQEQDVQRLSQEREAALRDMYDKREEAAILKERNQNLEKEARQAKAALTEQQLANAHLAKGTVPPATLPTTVPSATGIAASPTDKVSSSTQPASGNAAIALAPTTRPTTPAGKPPTVPQVPRPTYSTNSAEAFDPK